MIRYLKIDEILELHFWIIEDFGGSHGVRDELGLKSLGGCAANSCFWRGAICVSSRKGGGLFA